jgi:CO dehydrogenase nickel-insertion accessory protein CooC1
MTVAELIAELQKMPQDALIYVDAETGIERAGAVTMEETYDHTLVVVVF